MRHFTRALPVLASLLATGAISSTALAREIEKQVPAGGRLIVHNYVAANPDCSSAGYLTLRLLVAPQHGRMTAHKGVGRPEFPPANRRYVCNARLLAAMVVEYAPDPGFSGMDAATLELFTPDGHERTDHFSLAVK